MKEFIRSFQPKLIPRSHVPLGGGRGGVIYARECGRLRRRESSCQTRRERLKLNLEGGIMMSPWLRLTHIHRGRGRLAGAPSFFLDAPSHRVSRKRLLGPLWRSRF